MSSFLSLLTGIDRPARDTPPASIAQRFKALVGHGSRSPSPLGPSSLEVEPQRIRIGGECAATLAVVGYPREVGNGWLEPLLAHPGRIEVSVHIDPVPAGIAAQRLKKQLARLESDRRADAAKGRLGDPEVDVAAEDAKDLGRRIARGEGKLFRVGLYMTVHAASAELLDAECARVRALCASMLLDAVPTTWRTLQGWTTTLPIGVDELSMVRSFDTAALSCAYPFSTSQFSSPSGVLYGTATKGAGLVMWDRYSCDNYNAVILAQSGAGKSYLGKLGVLRALYRGVEVCVVDPEDEYARLARGVGGSYIHLGAPGVRINPFDLVLGPEALIRRALFIHTLVAVLIGGTLTAVEKAALDRAIVTTYARAGITSDPATHSRTAPMLADLSASLRSEADPISCDLANRMSPFVDGTHRGLFDGPTTTQPDGHLVVYSLRDLPDELKAAGTLLTLDAIWRTVSASQNRRRREVVVEEAWQLMAEPEGARFLFRMAKSARKHWCGLTVITQDAGDLLATDLGNAIVANASTQILLRQAPQAIEQIAESFRLSQGERAYLLGARRGDGLLIAGTERVAFRGVASDAEHVLATTDPAELASMECDESDF